MSGDSLILFEYRAEKENHVILRLRQSIYKFD